MLKQVSYQEFPTIYQKYIVQDFPRMERRPLKQILGFMKQGQYSCLLSLHNGKLQAYACILHSKHASAALLDYFAVMPDLRGAGVGSQFLLQLQNYWQADGLVIECEMPCKAGTLEEYQIRKRRIDFYIRSGARLSKLGWRTFGVDYSILWLPIRRNTSSARLASSLYTLYRLSKLPFFIRNHLRLYKIDPQKALSPNPSF